MNDLSNKNVKNKIGYHREVDITIRGRGGSIFLRKKIVFQNHLLEKKSTRYKNILMYRLLNTITKVASLIPYHGLKFACVLQRGLQFSLGTLVSFTNKSDIQNITEILLKVALNINSPTP
jgi:hypothetical protein